MEFIQEGRKLVTVRKINSLDPIPNADAIEVATVDGWNVVVKKGEFTVGDYCLFFEIDCFLPVSDGRFSFLTKSGVKIDEEGKQRIRLKSVKLRGQISQGLALPVTLITGKEFEDLDLALGYHPDSFNSDSPSQILKSLEDSRDGIEKFFNVLKYERPDEKNGGAGRANTAGSFPISIPKTDEERIQNVFSKYKSSMKDVKFRSSLKLDGSSQTIAYLSDPNLFINKLDEEVLEWNEYTKQLEVVSIKPYPFKDLDSQLIVCSRNLVLKYDENVSFWKAANKDDIPNLLKLYCESNNRQLALQGECMGPGIQGNRENLTEHEFFCFRVWDITNQYFLDDAEFQEFTSTLGINVVPQGEIVEFFNLYEDVEEALKSAEHKSLYHEVCEGDVYKSITKVNGVTVHFKVINNKFLLRCED